MKLISLELEGFGRFEEKKKVSFTPGINYIGGLNETGKSTVLEAIMASIFKYGKRDNIDNFYCWNNPDVCRVSLEYETDKGEVFRIISDYVNGIRRLEKKSKSGEFSEITSVDKSIATYLRDHFGFDDKKVFENTAFIRQSQMQILADDPTKNKIRDMIEAVFVGSAKSSTTKAIKKIKDASKLAMKEIEKTEDSLKILEDELDDASAVNDGVQSDTSQHEKISKELAEKQTKLQKLQKDKKAFDEKENLLKELEHLDEQISDVNDLVGAIETRKPQTETQYDSLALAAIILGILISLSGFVSVFGFVIGVPLLLYGLYRLSHGGITQTVDRNVNAHIADHYGKKQKLIDKKAVLEKRLEEYKYLNFNHDRFTELENLRIDVEQMKEREIELRTGIKKTKSLTKSPDEIEEKINALQDKLDELENRKEEHDLAAKYLEMAETRVHEKFTPKLSSEATPLLKAITNGHYQELDVDKETLDIKLKAPELDEFIDVSLLSQGTKDQAYFVLRSVMVNQLSGEKNLPLILDDPFHNFDNERLKKTMKSLDKLSKEKQVLLVSHRPYDKEFKDIEMNSIYLVT
jgi:DNA repair exonuclease SbcCD ATPase subunit